MVLGHDMFCPKCGSLMRPTKKNGSPVLVCPKCGYSKSPDASDVERLTDREKVKVVGDGLVIVEDPKPGNDIDYTVVCPKCGSKGAYYKNHYDLSSDSGFTIYKCVKCGYTWREEE